MTWILLSLAAAVFIGISYILTKEALQFEHAYELHLTGMTLTVLFGIPFMINAPFIASTAWWLVAVKAAVVGLGQYTGLRSFRHLELSEAAPLRNLSSLIVLVLAIFFLGESLSPLNIAGVAVLVLGTYFLEKASHESTSVFDFSFIKNKFVLLALASVILLAISAILDKYLVPILGFRQVWFAGNILIVVFMAIVYSFQGKPFVHIIPNLKAHPKVLIGGSIAGFFGGLLYFAAVAQPDSLISIIIPIRRLSILFALFFSWKTLHEHNVLHKTGATAIMLAGFVMTVL